LIFMVVLFAMALVAGGWGRSRYGYLGWSPAGVVLLVAVMLLFTGHLSVGCAPAEAEAEVVPSPSAIPAAGPDDVETQTKERARAAQVFAYARKAEFIANMERELAAIQVESEKLAARADGFDAAKKADAELKIDAMREQWIRTREQLSLAESADEITWEDVRGGFEKSFGELKRSLDTTRRWLSDKIES